MAIRSTLSIKPKTLVYINIIRLRNAKMYDLFEQNKNPTSLGISTVKDGARYKTYSMVNPTIHIGGYKRNDSYLMTRVL